MGLMFTGLLGREVWRKAGVYRWPSVRCQLVESEVAREEKGDGNYFWKVRYEYEVGGIRHQGTQYRRNYRGSSDYSEALRLALRHPVEATATCFVDPGNASEAVLEREGFWEGLFILIPLIFVGVGAGGIYFTWWPPRSGRESEDARMPVSDGVRRMRNRGVGCLFAVFFLVGCGATIGLFVVPVIRVLSARLWPAVPCRVVSSSLRSHSGEGTTYSVDILYRYEVGGREYQSNRYNFMGGSTSGRSGKQEIVKRHKPGMRTVCYVDPSDPTLAVLNRGLTADMLFGLIPLAFVAVGGGGLWYLRKGRRERTVAEGHLQKWLPKVKGKPVDVRAAATGSVPLELKASMGPGVKLLLAVAVAVFWNGIVSVFAAQMVQSWVRGRPDWCLTLFLIPFEIVGVGMIGYVVYAFLAFFNPRVTLVVSRGSVCLGQSVTVAWRISGGHQRIARLRLWLMGREEATYQRGTSTTTDKSTFAKIPIVDAVADQIAQGKAVVQVPLQTMHSLDVPNNRLVWVICVEGEIPKWPDIKQEYPIVVLPAEMREEGGSC